MKTVKNIFINKIKDGNRPIHLACRSNNVEVVKLLHSKHCDLEAENNVKLLF